MEAHLRISAEGQTGITKAYFLFEEWRLMGLRRVAQATRRNIPEDTIFHSHRRENIKSYIIVYLFAGLHWNHIHCYVVTYRHIVPALDDTWRWLWSN
jgi:hypothetical protein